MLICLFSILFYCLIIAPKTSVARVNWQQYVHSETHDKASTDNALPYPNVYLAPVQDNQWCEDHYGPPYLRFLADHHIPYCESGSKSTLECFRTNKNDPLCVARGVSYNPNPRNDIKKFSMHCKARNFTLERAEHSEKAKELADIKDISEFETYFYDTGVKEQLKTWELGQGADTGCTAKQNDNMYTLLVRREGNDNIWNKLLELWQALVTVDALQMALLGPGKAYLPSSEIPHVQVVFEDDVNSPWDDLLWGMITGSKPLRLSSLKSPMCLGTVILPLAGSSSPFWDSHWESRNCKNNFMLDPFLSRIFAHLGIGDRHRLREETVVTIIDGKKKRRIMGLQQYLPRLQARHPNATIRVVDLADMSLRKQILMIQETDVLVGAIGAGLTHSMFLPKESTLAEIFPVNFEYHGFRNLAKMRGLNYFSVHAVEQEEWERSRADEHQKGLKGTKMRHEDETVQEAVRTVMEEKAGKRKRKRWNWQNVDFYLKEDAFERLLDAAIMSQYQRGLKSIDVLGQE